MKDAKEWETGGRQRRLVDSAMNVLSTALAGRPAAEVVASGLSPMVNHHIKEATKGQSDAVNLTAHALWGAVEAYAGNRNVAAGAAGAVAGEAAAKVIAETLYGKSPNALSQEEKLTVSTLSQAAAGIAGGALANSSDGVGIAAQTAKGAVENNLLSKREDNQVYELLELYEKKGYLSQRQQESGTQLLAKDGEIDRLIRLNQTEPEKLTEEQKAYLDRELRAIAASYNVPLETLYQLDFSKMIKRDDSALRTYLNSRNTLNNAYDMQQAQSLKDGLEVGSFVYGGSFAPHIGGVFSKYPILAEKVSNAGLSAGFTYLGNTMSGKETTAIDLLWSGGTGFITGGQSFKTTLGINMASSGIQALTEGKDPLYASFSSASSTVAGGILGKGAEKAGYGALVGNINKNKGYYEPKYRNQESYDLLNKEYKYYPAKFGTAVDSFTSEYLNQKLNNNEKNIKNQIGGVYSDK